MSWLKLVTAARTRRQNYNIYNEEDILAS